MPWGGVWKKEWGKENPSPKGFRTPFRLLLCFSRTQISTREPTETIFGRGPESFLEARSLVRFALPPCVLQTPTYHDPTPYREGGKRVLELESISHWRPFLMFQNTILHFLSKGKISLEPGNAFLYNHMSTAIGY